MLIFLDIDGVMVPAKGWKAPELLNDGFPAFSNKATHTLQQLIAEDNTVMLTTSHRNRFTVEEWKRIFEKRGLSIANLTTLPEQINGANRKEELQQWFNLNDVDEDFIIIDDDTSLNDLPQYLKQNLIQTSPYIGLTERHLETVNQKSLGELAIA
jgi:16S rRNA C1402 (ribose-2'-O) methylase RsmI